MIPVCLQPNTQNKREANLTRILVLMVFCFLFCNLGKFILNMYDMAVGFDRVKTCTKVILSHSLEINNFTWGALLPSPPPPPIDQCFLVQILLFYNIFTQYCFFVLSDGLYNTNTALRNM